MIEIILFLVVYQILARTGGGGSLIDRMHQLMHIVMHEDYNDSGQ
ncbi:MAG: hypothetical protein BWY82_01365 [Verrucomicrobia bacterium ADurb.Bin474]|nr:MAG: hypothetical protein BWY82_01365 [Verrucomicrobia bacterium ADurb.Bin474]